MELDVCMKKTEDESWGFRLIGGSDYGMPLTVVKVIPNTPADRAGLRRGDAVVEVNGRDAAEMTHDQSREAVTEVDGDLVFGVVRGLYDLALDDTEPLFETDQQDFDQPLATEVEFEVPCPLDSQFKPINPEFDIKKFDAANNELSDYDLGAVDLENNANKNGFRSLTASPYMHQTKPYRPFSTEPIEVPPIENPIILNPSYHDDFAKLFIDEDLLPATRFKLPISEQYDPDGTKMKMKNGGLATRVEDVKSIEETTMKEVNEELLDKIVISNVNESIAEQSCEDIKEQTKNDDVTVSDKIRKEMDINVIELTATNIVDESIEKAVIVAEDIQNEIAVEKSETKDISSKSILETEEIKKTEQTKNINNQETASTETKEHVEMVDKSSEKIKKIERKNEIIYQETSSTETKENVEMVEKTSENIVKEILVCEKSKQYEDDPAIVRRKISGKDIQETLSEENKISGSLKSSIDENKVNVNKVNESRQTSQSENMVNTETKAKITNDKSSTKYSTTKLLSEQRAYTIGLQTIPNLRGSVHSSYHYDLLLRTFFIHLTDVMVALSRFILAEPVLSKSEPSTTDTTQQKNTTKIVGEHEAQESIIKQKLNIQEATVLVEASKKESIVKDKTMPHAEVAATAASLENIEQKKMDQKSVVKEIIKTNFASEDKVVTPSTLEKVESKANVEAANKKYVEYDHFNNVENQNAMNRKMLSGSKMSQLTEKKSKELMQNMEAVLTEFESKSVGEDIATVRDRRSRSRSRAEERTFEENLLVSEEIITENLVRSTKSVSDVFNNTSTTKSSRSVNISSSNEKLSESGNTYVAIVEAHVYTNKDAIFTVNSIENESLTETVDKVGKNNIVVAKTDKAVVQNLNENLETSKEVVKQTIEESKAEEISVNLQKEDIVFSEIITAQCQQPDIIKKTEQTEFREIIVPKQNTEPVITAAKIKEIPIEKAVAINQDYKTLKKNVYIEEIIEPIIETQGVNCNYIVTEAKEDSVVVIDKVADVIVSADGDEKIKQKKDVEEIIEDFETEEALKNNVLKKKSENQYTDYKHEQFKQKEENVAVKEKSTKQEIVSGNKFEQNVINAMESVIEYENMINRDVAEERVSETKASQGHEVEEISIESTKQEYFKGISVKQNTENLSTVTYEALAVAEVDMKDSKATHVEDVVDKFVMENSVASTDDRISQKSIKKTSMKEESANTKFEKHEIAEVVIEDTKETHAASVVDINEAKTDLFVMEDFAARTEAEERIRQKSITKTSMKEESAKLKIKKQDITEIDIINDKIEKNIAKSFNEVEISHLTSESTINYTESQTVEQESSFVVNNVDTKALKLSLDTEIAKNCKKTSIASDENNNLECRSPATVPPTPLTDEYVFKLEIPLQKREGPPIPRDCTPSDDEEDPHIVKKGLVPIVETEIVEQTIFDPPLPTPPVTPGSPTSPKSPRSPTSPNGPKFPRYTKPGLRGGADRDYAQEEILEIERKSSLLASVIDQTIKSIEEYKQEVGMKETTPPHETNGVIYNGYAKVVETKVFDTAKNNSVKITANTEVTSIPYSKMKQTETKTDISKSNIKTAEVEIDNKSTDSTEYNATLAKTTAEPVVSTEIKTFNTSIEETKEELEINNHNAEEINTMKQETVNTAVVEDKRDPMEGYKSVHFNPDELLNAQRERRALYAQVPQTTASQERDLYKNEKGEIIGTKRGIVDGLEEAVVEAELAKELGKPGITETKIAELISGESEMLREAHVMGLTRTLTLHMQRNDCSVDFNKLKPIVQSLKDSEVLKALNEEMLKAYEEKKKKEEKSWTTFLQKPKRPVPRSKFGFAEPEEQAEPYKVKIVKQPKPKVAPDYKPKDFNTGLLPWEERALREPTPPPVDPEEPILIPEEEPEILEAVDPLPESEVPDLEDSGIPLPPPEAKADTPPPEEKEEEETEKEVDLDIEAVIEETEKIVEENLVEEMDKTNLAEQLITSVQNMVDPNASLDQQLAQMRAQLAALAQLPGVIQQSLEIVTKQLSQLSQLETTQQSVNNQEKVVESSETATEDTKEDVQEVKTEATATEESNKPLEETETQMPQVPVEVEQTLTPEELERMKKEEEAMIEEQRRMEKMKKEAMEQARIEHESRQVKQHSVPRVGKPKPVFGPATPQERPLVLPGGRKWRKPKDAYNEQLFAETLAAQAEIISGKAKGVDIGNIRHRKPMIIYEIERLNETWPWGNSQSYNRLYRINFMKYEKPPVSLDHLKNSDVYKLIHDTEDRPPKRVELLTSVVAESDYREKCRSMTPCADRIAQQVQP